jgi:hypothetical protein
MTHWPVGNKLLLKETLFHPRGLNMNSKCFGLLTSIAVMGMGGSAASAAVLYQSIPDLTAPPNGAPCSSCNGVYQAFDTFSLGALSNISDVSFAAYNYSTYLNSATNITLDIYAIAGGLPGNRLFSETFSSAQYLIAAGNSVGIPTSIVSVSPSDLVLGPGTYDISFFSPVDLAPGMFFSIGHNSFQQVTLGDNSQVVPYTDEALGFSLQGSSYRRDRALRASPIGRLAS